MMRSAAWLCLAVFAGTAAATAEELSPLGKWRTFDEDTGRPSGVVEIVRNGDTVQGRIVRIIPQPGDPVNPVCRKCDGPDRNQPYLGMTIMKGYKQDGDAWEGGTILDPRSGNVYSSELRVGEGGRKLFVRGYIGLSMLGRTRVWVRAD
jgi:uncharacterized protein (DUF2147 family)